MCGHFALSGFLLQDLRQLVVAVEQLHELLEAAFTVKHTQTHTNTGKYTNETL